MDTKQIHPYAGDYRVSEGYGCTTSEILRFIAQRIVDQADNLEGRCSSEEHQLRELFPQDVASARSAVVTRLHRQIKALEEIMIDLSGPQVDDRTKECADDRPSGH